VLQQIYIIMSKYDGIKSASYCILILLTCRQLAFITHDLFSHSQKLLHTLVSITSIKQLLLVKILSYLTNVICYWFLPHVVIIRHTQCIKHQSHVRIVKLLLLHVDMFRYILLFLISSHTVNFVVFLLFF
jgi:hypothetical protein